MKHEPYTDKEGRYNFEIRLGFDGNRTIKFSGTEKEAKDKFLETVSTYWSEPMFPLQFIKLCVECVEEGGRYTMKPMKIFNSKRDISNWEESLAWYRKLGYEQMK